MRIACLLILISCYCLNAANSYAQNTRLSLEVKNVKIKDVFNRIENESEYIFFYSGEINVNQSVSVYAADQTIYQVMDQVLENTGYTYKVDDRQVFILKKEEPVAKALAPAPQEVQQQITVSGIVVDPSGEPVIGANVVVKNQPYKGTATDVEGRFSLEVKPNTVLQISYIGYITQEVTIKNATPVRIVLKEDSEIVEEVVVVGFGKQRKESVVGAIQTVKPSELRIQSSNLSSSFAGRIAGMVSVQRSGEPGADGASFWIRGISTFAENKSPLIFIDNVEVSTADMNALSPEVIESFSVLKDATATALYGARGANGVMLITTRSGKNMEKARINIRAENSFTQPTKTLKIADGIDYMNARNNAVLNRTPDAQPYFSQEVIEATRRGDNPYIFPNVDWQKYLFKDFSARQTVNLNVTGGGNRAVYFMNATINNDNGMLKKDPQNKFDNNISQLRLSLQGNIGVSLTPTTKANLRIITQILNYHGSSASTGEIYQGIFEAPGVLFQPVIPAQKGEEHILFGNRNGGPVSGRYKNPYAMMVSGYQERSESTLTASFDMEQDLKFITPGLVAKALISFKNWSQTKITRKFDPFYYNITDYEKQADGSYTYDYDGINKGRTALDYGASSTGDRHINYQISLDYARKFGVHDIGAMLVFQQRNFNSNAPSNFYASLPTRNQGLSGRITYGYDNRYLVEANFGYNGSENFDKGKRFGFFPSFALGYNISNEEYFAPLTDIISNLKLRGSWGMVGTSHTDGRFPYLSFVNLEGAQYIFGQDWQTTQKGAVVTRYGAPGARWETGTKTNVGVDMGFLNNMINLSVDVFHEIRKDIFMQRVVIPAESGVTGNLRPYANLGKVKNQGIDLTLDVNKAVNKDLIIGLRGSFTFAKNTILERDEPEYEYAYLSREGHPVHGHRGLVALGLFKDEEDIENSPTQTYSSNLKPGDIKYKDVNEDGKIDDLDMVAMGNPTVPQIVYGFGGSFQYKKIDFSIFFQGVAQTSLMMSNFHPFSSDQTTLLDFIAQDYWTEENPNPNAAYPRLISNLDSHNNFKSSSFWLRDGDFMRLKNVEIGYSYKMARIYLSGQNLLTFSKFKHWDPELGGGRGLSYPNLRSASVGVQLTF